MAVSDRDAHGLAKEGGGSRGDRSGAASDERVAAQLCPRKPEVEDDALARWGPRGRDRRWGE